MTFSVSAIGTGTLRYQWRKDGVDLAAATKSTLTLTNVQLANAGLYTVVITDDVGPMISAPASLVVLCEPAIVLAPLSQAVVAGAQVTLSVSVTNTATLPIGYRWRRNNSYVPGAFVSLTQRTAFFTITNAQLPFTNYSVLVTNQVSVPSAAGVTLPALPGTKVVPKGTVSTSLADVGQLAMPTMKVYFKV